ncbi:putative RNA polymerase II subunit B1 CTD phosphatase RPAP2 homolog [Ctenocephalides felis]|uniref:putative RNA polymerase II subunit B1 CTD phosphatase RPAP2 homolog n=1 Tax=Ctenocephalides felis TaxID=7515 RepID=UPI000E6E5438|nr:putative RNA polymerase II subunit B1 CTD phosphatase RPAP2 homolog [Ctenocephalides felis]
MTDTCRSALFNDDFLNDDQAYLEDVFEERFILKICGYPLCDNQLGSIPKHKFKISTSVNKVYDITERKKFCSPQCFTAAKYIREQLPSSPLWVLENEEKRCYKLWNHTKSFSSLGDEIQLKYDNINENGIDNH